MADDYAEDASDDPDEDIVRPDVMEDAADLLSKEEYITSLFDEVSKKYINNNTKEARDTLRDFASHNTELYEVIMYLFAETDDFSKDIQNYFDERSIEKLHTLREKFSGLQTELRLVHLEENSDQINPLTNYSVTSHQSSDSDGLIIEYSAKSGDVSLVHTKVSAPHIAYLAISLLNATNSGLENVAGGEFSIASRDMEDMRDAVADLEDQIEDLHDNIESISEEQIIETDEDDEEGL